MEKEILEAQSKLEEVRKFLPVSNEKQMELLSRTSPVVFQIGRVNGECGYHPGSSLPCADCQEQWDREDQERLRVSWSRTENLLGSIRLGKRYQGKEFSDYMPTCEKAIVIKKTCQRYAETFKVRLDSGDSILMLGDPGTGKNLLSACICGYVAKEGFSVLHTTAMKAVRRIKDGWSKKEEEQAVINSFTTPDLLVIDEVGVQFGSKTEILLLTEIINERYEQMRPVIVISNLPLKDEKKEEDLERYLGVRAIDRFYEGKSSVLEFTWESYRRR